MKPESYRNARGEQVMSYPMFKQLSVDAVLKSLLPGKAPRRRRRAAR